MTNNDKNGHMKMSNLDQNSHLTGTKNAEDHLEKGSSTTNGASKPRQQGLCINTQPWLKDFDGGVKGDKDRRITVGNPVRHLAREYVPRAGRFALGRQRERMEVDPPEHLLYLLVFLFWQIKLFVANRWWPSCQKRRAAAKFFIKKWRSSFWKKKHFFQICTQVIM